MVAARRCEEGAPHMPNEASTGSDAGADAARLAAYEAFAAGTRAELADVTARMDELKAAGKVKSATYRQLFATRATLKDIDRRLRERGL